MPYFRACHIDDLADGKLHGLRVLAREIIVLLREGEIVAFEGNCKHQRAPLSTGTIENNHLVCSWHGWRYDIKTGRCTDPDWAVLRRYPVKLEDGYVWVGSIPVDEPTGDTQ